MITISLCMIVKNEEAVLARCLDSLKDLVDEIIIVDTGSTDATREIAAGYTKNIYDYQWIDDFADARNYSFSKATMEYIYCADADEVLDEVNRRRFWDLKQVLDPQIDVVQMYYCNQLQFNTVYNYDKEYRPKLYKRIRRFTFVDPVHEMVRLEPVVFDSDIEIMHLPQAPHGARDLYYFEKMVREGVYISKRLHSMYAKELFIAGNEDNFKKAEHFFEESARDETRSEDELSEAFCVVAHAARIQNKQEQFFKYALKSVAGEGCSEICCELGDYYYEKSDYEEAALWYWNAAFETESILSLTYKETYPLEKLILCYEQVNNIQAAEEMRDLLEKNNS